jgi:hypothetical protein
MNEPVGDQTKMEAAHAALHGLIGVLPTDANLNVGLRAYSHRSAGADKPTSCQDSELLVPAHGVDKDKLDAQVDSIAAVGEYTPMAYAVQQAAQEFPNAATGGRNVIVLVTDGKENCQADPAALIKAAAAPLGLVVDVIGFDVQADAEAQAQLQAIAAATGGTYVLAQSADDLSTALQRLAAEQVKVIPPQTGPGQVTLGVIPGATMGRLQIWGSDGLVVDDFSPKSQYQLAAGLYDVQIHPAQSGSNTCWFRVEVAAGRESTIPLGGMALTSRQAPAEFAIEDDAASRRVADGYTLPQQPFLLPPGHYTVQVKQSGGADWQIVQRTIEVQPNTIVQVNL